MPNKQSSAPLALITSGFFVDWDGKIRDAARPGKGLRCVTVERDHMEVIERSGETSCECTWYDSIEGILKVCPTISTAIVGVQN